MKLKEFISSRITIFDGAMGSMLQQRGLKPGELPERWNLTHPEIVRGIHKEYLEAGADFISTDTFGLNSFHYDDKELEEIAKAAVCNVRSVIGDRENKFVAFNMGPCGKMLKPLGDLPFEEAVSVFAKTARLAEKYGADLIIIETMNDCYETKAALLAAKENTSLPVFVSNAYTADGKLFMGADPAAMVAMIEGLGADAIGANCSLGPEKLKPVVKELIQYSSLPVVIQPNAGIPREEGGRTVYDVSPREFAKTVAEMADMGAVILGGCCGTTPEYIRCLKEELSGKVYKAPVRKNYSCASSYTHSVFLGGDMLVIGERLNPSGKEPFKKAIEEHDISYVMKEALQQEEEGAQALDLNVGVPGTDEVGNLSELCCEIQAVTSLPLQFDSSNPKALEAALRLYNGKAMINSVNGKEESLSEVLPLVKKYGGLLVCLCLDEKGIPDTAEGRLAIAEKILERAESAGIDRKDLVFDALTLPVSANVIAGKVTLETVSLIKERLGCKTILGLSNVSFGLPQRELINAAFMKEARECGLDAAIINPQFKDIDIDLSFDECIEKAGKIAYEAAESIVSTKEDSLQNAIIRGLRTDASRLCRELLKDTEPMDIVHQHVVPALDVVGKAFEEKKIFLPQLLLSAEAAKNAFEEIKAAVEAKGTAQSLGENFVIATVKGDIHDIGKNIVKLLLGNYGFNVIDLGKDVPADKIVRTVKESGSRLCGLSALMTTTVPSMEETIKLLKKEAPDCTIIVGGAVLTEDYARKIGADSYAKDAMATVRFAQEQKK